MSLIRTHFFSKCLNRMTCVNVILPMPRDPHVPVSDLPVLYLLHGMSDDYTMWIRRTCVEACALRTGIAVVMPDGGLSCYENMEHGGRYADYLIDELPEFICGMFPVSRDREKTFIAGCSMGGCGALKLAAHAPHRWSAVGAMSGGHLEFRPNAEPNHSMLKRAYGDHIAEADARILADFNALADNSAGMRIFQYWGDHDYLRETCLETKAYIETLAEKGNIRYEGCELPGRHDWELWDVCIHDLMPRLNMPKPKYRML